MYNLKFTENTIIRIMFHVKHSEVFRMEIFLNCFYAFLVGGFICLVGQVLIDYTKLTPARILVSYVVAGGCFDRNRGL